MNEERIKIGISSCLLGNKVRWDGNHKQDQFLTDTLGQYVDYVPICPEMECGMGVPREPMRLVGDPLTPRLMTTPMHKDFTDQMKSWAGKRLLALEKENLCGYIFKCDSPSCGMIRVKVYSEDGKSFAKNGVGIFARMFMDHFPQVPVEDDEPLHDETIREKFIERIFYVQKMADLIQSGKTLGGLGDFQVKKVLESVPISLVQTVVGNKMN